jgi:hypothetical protein
MTEHPSLSARAVLLREAEALVTGDRNNTYGPPTQDFRRTADMLTALGFRAAPEGREIEAHDVAVIVIAVKLSRLTWSPAKRDSWVDIAGYAACGNECAEEAAGRPEELTPPEEIPGPAPQCGMRAGPSWLPCQRHTGHRGIHSSEKRCLGDAAAEPCTLPEVHAGPCQLWPMVGDES